MRRWFRLIARAKRTMTQYSSWCARGDVDALVNAMGVRNLNRKLTHLNAVSPEILVGQIWLQEEPNTVEIIELNTSDEFDPSTDEALDKRFNHAWSFTNKEKFHQIEDNYKINNKARERRRLNHENHLRTTNTATNTFNHMINNNFYSDILENQYIGDSQLINQQVNCVTMINKNFPSSDSSSDTDIEIITSDDLTMDPNNWDVDKHPYQEEIITYDPELDKETRTIWIYSFKNKHLLTEDDCELTDTAAKDMSFCSTSSSTERDEEKTKDKSTSRRLGSPIPPTYIPRLDLTLGPTLSTVSEVSEPNKQTSPNLSYNTPKSRFQKLRNSWFATESDRMDTPTSVDGQLEKSTNIVNWMALSPREKRRRSEEQTDKWVGSFLKLETLPIEESKQQIQEGSEQDNTLRLQVDVDVHVSINEKPQKKRSLGTPNSANVILKLNNDKKSPIDLLCAPMDAKGDSLDRGDNVKFGQTQQVLCLTGHQDMAQTFVAEGNVVFHKVGDVTLVEEPLPVIDKKAFDNDEKIEVQTATYDFLTEKLELAKADADAVWMKKNAPFLVPAEWIQYAEVADPDPPLSIELSIPNAAPETPLPWYKRLFKGLNCFKAKSK